MTNEIDIGEEDEKENFKKTKLISLGDNKEFDESKDSNYNPIFINTKKIIAD